MTTAEAINKLEYEVPYVTNSLEVAVNQAIEALEKQEKYRWHDLKKNPKDLPIEFKEVLVIYEYFHYKAEVIRSEYGIGYVHNDNWCGMVATGKNVRQLAWRYIEPFEEVDE